MISFHTNIYLPLLKYDLQFFLCPYALCVEAPNLAYFELGHIKMTRPNPALWLKYWPINLVHYLSLGSSVSTDYVVTELKI